VYNDLGISHDADEFLEPRESEQTLYDAIATEDPLWFNMIQFDNSLFCLTGHRTPHPEETPLLHMD